MKSGVQRVTPAVREDSMFRYSITLRNEDYRKTLFGGYGF